jgi:hypothetical protein
MRKQIDHFLLGSLWLIASVLGASFWFGTNFGFNLFDGQHWHYLGQLQASGASVRPSFYISMIAVVVVMISGLYLLIRPKFKRIGFQRVQSAPDHNAAARASTLPAVSAPTPNTVPLSRPPRLKLAASNTYAAARTDNSGDNAILPAISAAPIAPAAPVAQQDFSEIEEIFKSAGYTVKDPPRIGGMRPALLAIGADETLWLGAVGIDPAKLTDAATRMEALFSETLEDIRININTFVVNPETTGNAETLEPELFDSTDALRDYMNAHKNRELTRAETEDFDAYSEYIDTVSGYFNKS